MSTAQLKELGLEQLKAGKAQMALATFAELEKVAGTATATRQQLSRAERLLREGAIEEAAAGFSQALEANPGLVDAHLGLLRIALATDQLDDARTFSRTALLLAPATALPWTTAGLVEEASGNVDGALKNLEKGAQLGAQVFMAQFNHGRVLAQVGRFVEAVTPLSQACALEPNNADAFSVLGLVLKALGQHKKAIEALERAKNLAPKDPEAWCHLIDALFDVREFDAAWTIAERALEAVGDHPAVLEKAVAVALVRSDVAGGIALVERQLAVVPDHAQGWLNLARLRLLDGQLDESLAAANALLRRDPSNAEAHFHLGNVYDAVPDEAKAEAAYRAAVAQAPGDWRYATNLAMLLIQSSSAAKHAEALALLEAITPKVPPGEFRPAYNRLLALTRLGRTAEAAADAKALLPQVPADDAMRTEVERLTANLDT